MMQYKWGLLQNSVIVIQLLDLTDKKSLLNVYIPSEPLIMIDHRTKISFNI